MSNKALQALSPNYCETVSIKFSIAQNHIDCGRRLSCHDCPVALALYERLGEHWAVGPARLTHETTGYELKTPAIVERFIFDFDSHHGVLPFEFTLDIPLALVPRDDSFLKEKAHA